GEPRLEEGQGAVARIVVENDDFDVAAELRRRVVDALDASVQVFAHVVRNDDYGDARAFRRLRPGIGLRRPIRDRAQASRRLDPVAGQVAQEGTHAEPPKKRRRMRRNRASLMMPPDILEVPWVRSLKMMGISLRRNPFFQSLYFSSIWKEYPVDRIFARSRVLSAETR